jgi:hypothetical protein
MPEREFGGLFSIGGFYHRQVSTELALQKVTKVAALSHVVFSDED